jgi:chromosomal replication initiation ATPase DnaA
LSVLTQEPAETEVELCVTSPAIIDMSKLSRTDRVIVACDGIIDIAAAFFNVSSKELREQGRSVMSVSRVRQIAMYVAHVELGFTMGEVGEGFGRERTTVLHACHQVEDLRDNGDFDAIVATMERLVGRAFGHTNREMDCHGFDGEE